MNSDNPSRPPDDRDATDLAADESDWRAASSAHHALFASGRDAAAAPGEIWSVADSNDTPDKEFLVAVVSAVADDAITIVPLSAESRFATEWDLMIPSIALGYDAVAQVKLAGTIVPRQLDQLLSSMPARSLKQIQELTRAAQAGISIPPAHLPLGPWVFAETDERLRVRKRCAWELRSYLTPALEDPTTEWQSFGSILVRGSLAIGADLSTLVELDAIQLKRLQSDELDPFSEVPARKMAALLTTLHIRWNQRIRDALYHVVLERFSPDELAQGSALGRRGKRSPRQRQPNAAQRQERQRAASEYVVAVERALEKP